MTDAEAPTPTDVVGWVLHRLIEDGVDGQVAALVLAALDGDSALDAELAGDGSARPLEPTVDLASETRRGIYLRSVSVEGFRGIGPRSTLELEPVPGLTIIAGRNGSGKSSFSEALELVLTGETYRWRKRSKIWRDGWRNLHRPDPAEISLGLVEDAAAPITLTTRWSSQAAAVDERETKSQRAGEKQQTGTASLGWQSALDRFRPILSYEELGGLLEGNPSELYDALASVLGVEQLSDAHKLATARLKTAKTPAVESTRRRRDLQAEAAALDDARADECASLLKKTAPDTKVLRGLATGTSPVDRGPVTALRQLAALQTPATVDAVQAATNQLRAAAAELAASAEAVSGRLLDRLNLLEEALRLHEAHGDMSCPVCHSGELDATWAAMNREAVSKERAKSGELDAARQSLRIALNKARALCPPRPQSLDRAPVAELEPALASARQSWDLWVSAPAGDDARTAVAFAQHLEAGLDDLASALGALRSTAAARADELDDRWQPYASRLAAWCAEWEDVLATKPAVDQLEVAVAWLKQADGALKNDRLLPIQQGASEVWAKLRQESNVELGALELSGSGTSRRVRIDSSVDGVEGGGLAVLSQGELHALALALFLPRATYAASPFRFLVLDDPVQAMDPAKVDGLVELLADLARTHQVVVLSHDDRLAAAARRAQVGARILEVRRSAGSVVSVDVVEDPAKRYLADAFALVKDEHLPEESLRRTLPGILRLAVESAARERFFAVRLQAHAPLVEIESIWNVTTSTRSRVSLAIYNEVRQLDGWASAPYRKFGLRIVATDIHGGLREDVKPLDAARDVERLIVDVQRGAR